MKDISSTGTSPTQDLDLEVELQVHCTPWLSSCFEIALSVGFRLQKLHSSVDLSSYENKPVPRPPEDS